MSLDKTVLVIEDDPELRELTGRMLSALGYNTHVAGSISGAVEALDNFKFDYVLSDYDMPDGNGRDLFTILLQEKYDPTPLEAQDKIDTYAALERHAGTYTRDQLVLITGNPNIEESGTQPFKALIRKPADIIDIAEVFPLLPYESVTTITSSTTATPARAIIPEADRTHAIESGQYPI